MLQKIHHYVYIPIGGYCQTAPLFRRHFKANKPFEELETDSGEFFRPPDFDGFPVTSSTVHPYAMMWKAYFELRAKNIDEVITTDSLRYLCRRALAIVDCWKIRMTSAGHVVPSSKPIDKGGDRDDDHSSDNGSSVAPTSDGRASSRDERSASNGDDNSNSAPAPTRAGGRSSHSQPAEGETEISEVSYSNYQPSLDYFPSYGSSTPALDDEESQEDDSRLRDLASYQPWSVDVWRSKDLHVADDDDAPMHDDELSLVYGSDEPSICLEEQTATLPVGDYGHWEPDFMKRMDETRLRELALRLGYVDDNDVDMD